LHPALQYRGQWDYMAVDGLFLTFHGRMVVPEAARAQVLATLHSGFKTGTIRSSKFRFLSVVRILIGSISPCYLYLNHIK
jgi:hypothetical protein